jgi:hypothetical protein
VSAKQVKVYPLRGVYLNGVPHAVHVVRTRSQAHDLEASGAFTTNPNHPDRDSDAIDLGSEPVDHVLTRYLGEEPSTEAPQEAAPSPESEV